MPVTPPELMRRLLNQIEKGKGVRFSAEELDLLVEMGLVEIASKAAADWVRQQSAERLALARGERGDDDARRFERPQRGRHHEATAEEAALRAVEMSQPKRGGRGIITPQDVEEARRRARSLTRRGPREE